LGTPCRPVRRTQQRVLYPTEALYLDCETKAGGGGVGLDGGWGCAGSSATDDTDTWGAAKEGDVGEVERLVGHDPGLLDARGGHTWTALVRASREGHVGVVRLLLDKGAAVNNAVHGR
jgi:hypothetical protein